MNHKTIRALAEEITWKSKKVFGRIFLDDIYSFLCSLYDYDICKDELIKNSIEDILNSLGADLLERLINLFLPFLLEDISLMRDNYISDNPIHAYEAYVLDFINNRKENIWNSDTECRRVIESEISKYTRASVNLLERLSNDINILSLLIEPPYIIKKISFGRGDLHNNGQAVCVIFFSDNQKIVYKPHSLQNDLLFCGVQQWMAENAEVLPLKCPRSFDRGDYGWQEYISNRECENEEEICRYMTRLGEILAFSYLLMSSDLHAENLIACGEYPVIIDLETLFSNNTGLYKERKINFFSELYSSVFISGLLPQNAAPGAHNADNYMSGILNSYDNEDNTVLINSIVDAGTIDIRVQEEKVHYSKVYKVRNHACIDGHVVFAGNYVKEITSGFTQIYSFVQVHADDFVSFLEQMKVPSTACRVVVRNTSLYNRFLRKSVEFKYFSKEGREMVLSRLKGKGNYLSGKHRELVENEIEQLLNLDIPYFYTYVDSKDLYTGDGGNCIEGFFGESIWEALQKRLEKLSERDLYRQLYFIRVSLADIYAKDRTFSLQINVVSGTHSTVELSETIIKYIYDYREQYHAISVKPSIIEYFTITPSKDRLIIDTEPATLYFGMGSALFYMQLYRLFGEPYSEKAYTFTDVMYKKYLQTSGQDDHLGLFTGHFSCVYMMIYAFQIFGERSFFEKAVKEMKEIVDRFDSFTEECDIIGGYAGCIISAINIYMKYPSESIFFEFADICRKRVIKVIHNKKSGGLAGFGHGLAGISAALIMCGKIMRNIEAYEEGMKLIRLENESFSKATNHWKSVNSEKHDYWCQGSVGILVGRAIALEYADNKDKALLKNDINTCLINLLNNVTGGSDGDVLCHGIAGNLSVLRWYGKKYDKRIYEKSIRLSDAFISRIMEKGVFFSNIEQTIDISFMTGLTGLGYYLEQLLDESIPNVLALEI